MTATEGFMTHKAKCTHIFHSHEIASNHCEMLSFIRVLIKKQIKRFSLPQYDFFLLSLYELHFAFTLYVS